jgi:predicted nucleic acid-binding protein
MRGLFDTSILIDYLNGVQAAKNTLEKFSSKFISIISWIEVLNRAVDKEEQHLIEQFLKQFTIVAVDQELSRLVVNIRQNHAIKLPNAIIWAAAEQTESLLVTRAMEDFPENLPILHVPYH